MLLSALFYHLFIFMYFTVCCAMLIINSLLMLQEEDNSMLIASISKTGENWHIATASVLHKWWWFFFCVAASWFLLQEIQDTKGIYCGSAFCSLAMMAAFFHNSWVSGLEYFSCPVRQSLSHFEPNLSINILTKGINWVLYVITNVSFIILHFVALYYIWPE